MKRITASLFAASIPYPTGRFEVVGDLAIVIVGIPGPSSGGFVIKVYDVSDPSIPLILTDDSPSLNIRGWSEPKDIKVVGDRIYVASELDPSGPSKRQRRVAGCGSEHICTPTFAA